MRTLALLALVPGLCAACGGADGDLAYEGLFVGPYRTFEMQAPLWGGSPQTIHSGWGVSEADGVSRLTIDLEWGEYPGLEEPACAYSVSADRAFHVEDSATVRILDGGVEQLGRVAVAGDTGRFNPARIVIYLSRIGVFDDASLTGTYHLAGLGNWPTSSFGTCAWSDCELTFDGYGFLTATDYTATAWNQQHVFHPPTTLTYAVDEDGGLWMDDLEGDPLLRGGVLPGGALALATESGGDYDTDGLVALIRSSQGLSTASLDGEYWVVGYKCELGGMRSLTGVFTADGSGGCGFEGTENLRGTVGPTDPLAWLYGVLPDGALRLTDPEGRMLLGGLSEDRKFFAVAGGGMGSSQELRQAWFLFGVAR